MAKKFLDESGLETLWDKVKSEDSSKLTEAKSYAETQASNALSNAKSYADEKIKEVGGITSDDLANTLTSAKSYADAKDSISVGGTATITNTTGIDDSKLTVYPYYLSGGPTDYGNILSIAGAESNACGGGQLALEWSGAQDGQDDNVGSIYYRSKRDNQDSFTNWKKLAFTDVATTSSDGLMSSGDKIKLDNLPSLDGFNSYWWEWGTLLPSNGYSQKFAWNADTGSVAFATKEGQTSIQIDGRYYDQEGSYMLVDTNDLATTLNNYATKSYSDDRRAYFSMFDLNGGTNLRALFGSTSAYLAIRYGSFQATAKTTYNITFADAGNYCRIVTQDLYAQADSTNSGYVTSASSTGFSFKNNSTTSRYIGWIAIGVKY